MVVGGRGRGAARGVSGRTGRGEGEGGGGQEVEAGVNILGPRINVLYVLSPQGKAREATHQS